VTAGLRVVEVGDALEFPGPGVAEAARTVSGLLRPDLLRPDQPRPGSLPPAARR
jgi:hypothetical protein